LVILLNIVAIKVSFETRSRTKSFGDAQTHLRSAIWVRTYDD